MCYNSQSYQAKMKSCYQDWICCCRLTVINEVYTLLMLANFLPVKEAPGNEFYLNLIAFTGEMEVTSIEGMSSTSTQTTSVPRLSSKTSDRLSWIGTNFM